MSCSCASYGSYIGNINCPSIPIPNLGIPCPTISSTGNVDTDNILYSGANLSCSNILTNDTLTTILGKIDSQICSAIGNFSTYNTGCLAPTPTLQSFVETISAYVCTTRVNLDNFTGTTFPTYQTTVTNALATISNPNLTLCSKSGIIAGDSLNTILTKLANSVCDIYDTQLNLASVNWAQCFVVGTAPTTISQAFSTIISQICQLNTLIQVSGGGTLPTFNTTGTCLPSPSTSDSLVSTVGKLITRSCATPTFDINALTWGCLTKPSTVTGDLQDAFQTVLTSVSNQTQNFPAQFSSDFNITNIDSGNPCLGKLVSLAVPSSQDRFVASTAIDTSPGTLQDKLVGGTGVTIDFTTSPGEAIINASSTGGGDGQVYVDVTDTVKDFLISKIEGGSSNLGVTIVPIIDATNSSHTLKLNLNIDTNTLVLGILSAITASPSLQTAFCNAINSCPSPCSAPSNVTVTYNSGTTTTSSTTTTTTT